MPSKKSVLGWVLVSYFLIAGGFMLAAVVLALLGVDVEPARQGAFFVGAFIGGVVAGRASPHKAVAEPAIAGLLVIGSLLAIFSIGLGWRLNWGEAGEGALGAALRMGLVTGLGGFVGGLFGRRSRTGAPSDSALRWWGIAMLINLGTTFIFAVLVWMLVVRSGDSEIGDPGVGAILLSLTMAALFSGFMTQAAAPRKMCWTCGAGTFSLVLLAAAFSTAAGDFSPSALVGAFMLWGIGTLIGAFGALIGWSLIASRIEPPTPIELPEVRLRS